MQVKQEVKSDGITTLQLNEDELEFLKKVVELALPRLEFKGPKDPMLRMLNRIRLL